jgi:hypothetical protein
VVAAAVVAAAVVAAASGARTPADYEAYGGLTVGTETAARGMRYAGRADSYRLHFW